MKKNDATYEEDFLIYDKTDDFDENCDSTEEEFISTEETDYDIQEKYSPTSALPLYSLRIRTMIEPSG